MAFDDLTEYACFRCKYFVIKILIIVVNRCGHEPGSIFPE